LAVRRGRLPLVVEVFPRLLTGLVIKSRQSERERYLSTLGIPNEFRRRAAASDDAFDAAVSALVMSGSVGELIALPNKPDDLIEGRIWQPQHSLAYPNGNLSTRYSRRGAGRPCGFEPVTSSVSAKVRLRETCMLSVT